MKWKDPFYSRPSVYDTFNILSGEQEGFDFSNPKIYYGGKGGGSSNAGTSTSTVTNTPPPEVLAAYQKALGMADTASSAPLQQYQGSTVAGFTPDQMQAFGTINNAQGTAQPYIDQATGLINQSNASLWNGAQKFSPDAISQYQNPYTQQVLNSQIGLEQNQDAMQQQALKGNAISSGAWGGDRAGVASAVLSGQQALANNSTNANILNTGYNQALGEFNQQQGAQLSADTANAQLAQQGAFGLGQLGTQALGTQLQGASSQLQSGALQQQLAQEQLNVPYQQFLQQQAYPFQTGQYYANIAEGIGSNSGGTGTTTTTGPQPSTASQLGGLGLGGLGLLGGMFGGSASGGRVFRRGGSVPRFASGGPSSYSATGVPDLSTNFIPETQGAHGSGPPTAAAIARAVEAAQNSGTNPQSLAGAGKGLSGLMSLFGGSGGGSGNVAGFDSLMQQLGGSASGDQAASDYINSSAGDQVASDVAAEDAAGSGDYFSGLFDWFNKGGKVKGAMGTRRGYADGGSTEHNNEWMSTIGNWIGTIIGSVYGGPAGGFVGSKAGSDAGGTLGDLFAGDWDQTGSDLEATVQGGLNPSIGGMGGNFSNTSKFGWARGGSARGFADGGDTTDGIYIPNPPPSQDDSFYERQAELNNELPPENILPGALPVPEQDLQPPGALGQMSPPIPATVQESLPAPQPNRQMVASAEPPISEDPRHVTRGKVDPWLALATAGFATAAGTSPYAGVNIGKGAVAGIENYVEQKKQANTVDEAADKLMTEADQHRKQLAIDQQNADTNSQYRQDQSAFQKSHLALEGRKVDQGKWATVKDALGNEYLVNPLTNETRDPTGVLSQGDGAAPTRSMMNIYNPPRGADGKPVQGEEYFQSIPPQIEANAKAYRAGTLPPPSGFAARSPAILASFTAAQKGDDNFAAHAATRYSTLQQFLNPNSKTAITVRSQNVAMDHIQTMREAVTALGNHDIRAFNLATNELARQTGQPEPANVEMGQNILGDELAKAVLGTGGGALADREGFKKGLGTGASLRQANGLLDTAEHYMAGQIHGLKRTYEAGTGFDDFAQRLNLSPAARRIMDRYSEAPSGGASAKLPTISSPKDPAFVNLPRGASFRTPDGRTMVKH